MTLPLLGFVFLVALGVDYTIFLMSRVREEVGRHGHADGVRRGLVTTGGVITSAGPGAGRDVRRADDHAGLVHDRLGAVVALGILLDTFVVRSLLVPALLWDARRRVRGGRAGSRVVRRCPAP